MLVRDKAIEAVNEAAREREKRDEEYLQMEKLIYRYRVTAILLVALAVVIAFLIWAAALHYHMFTDGRSYIGDFVDGEYYYQGEGHYYKWTEEVGREEVDKSDYKIAEHRDSDYEDYEQAEECREAFVKYGKYAIENVPDKNWVQNVYYISESGEKTFICSFDYCENYLMTDGTYLVAHTDRYQGRQGKTIFYKIIYDDENRTVSETDLVDVWYDMRGIY
jgi:hypothetical protein